MTLTHSVEVVLSVLVANFRFDLAKKPVHWNFAGITFPAASPESKIPEMYLKVSKA